MPAVSLDNVNITDGTLIYRDAVAKSEQKIEALNANLAAASLQGPFGAKGSLNYQGLPATFDVSTGKIDPALPAPVAIALGLGGAGSQGDAQIKFTGTLAQAADGVSAVGKLEGGSANLAAALEAVAPGSGSGAPIALDKPFKIAGDVNYAPSGGKIEKFTLALGDLTAAGDVSFTPGTPSQAAVKLAINRIDLDALLAQAAAKPAAPAEETAPQEASAFALPTGINAAVDIAIDAISYRGGLIDNTKFVGELANGEFAIKQFSAQLPGGAAVSAAGALTAVDGKPQIGGALEAKADNLRASAGLAAGGAGRRAGGTAAHPGADQPLHRRRRPAGAGGPGSQAGQFPDHRRPAHCLAEGRPAENGVRRRPGDRSAQCGRLYATGRSTGRSRAGSPRAAAACRWTA